MPVGLLASHVRALEAAVGGSTLAHEKFEWRMMDAAWADSGAGDPLPAMVHVETGFLFSIEYHPPWQDEFGAGGPAEFRYFRSPGVQGETETIEARSWDEVLFDFRLWLRLIAREIGRHDGGDLAGQDRRKAYLTDLWTLIHPDIRTVAGPRFDARRYADAVHVALAQVNATETFARAVPGLVSPVTHPNAEMNEATAIHFLFLASLLRYKIAEATAAIGQSGNAS